MDVFNLIEKGVGVSSELSAEVDEVLLFQFPIVEPFLHLTHELSYALRLETAESAHLLVLSQRMRTFFLNLSNAFSTKSRISFSFYCGPYSSSWMMALFTLFISSVRSF